MRMIDSREVHLCSSLKEKGFPAWNFLAPCHEVFSWPVSLQMERYAIRYGVWYSTLLFFRHKNGAARPLGFRHLHIGQLNRLGKYTFPSQVEVQPNGLRRMRKTAETVPVGA